MGYYITHMNIKLQSMAPVLGMFITTGGIIFQIGKHSERLEVIGLKVEAQEKEVQNTYQGISPSITLQLSNEDHKKALDIANKSVKDLELNTWKYIFKRWK